jgi:hypothetical protein
MPGPSDPGFDTLALHAGAAPDPATGARATPIHLTTSFVFESSEHAASLFNMERAGHVYSRISNPTTAVFEERVAALEGGVGAIATASGQAALHLAIATIAGAGSHIVASAALYGGSHNLLHYTLSRFGIETTFVKPRDIDAWRAAIRPNTKLLFGESLGNPGLDVLDIPRVSPSRTTPACRCWSTPRSRRRGCSSRSSSAPTSCSIRRRSSCPATAPSSAACWSTRRPLRLGTQRPLPRADRALRRLPRHGVHRGAPSAPSCCARAARACATSAPA